MFCINFLKKEILIAKYWCKLKESEISKLCLSIDSRKLFTDIFNRNEDFEKQEYNEKNGTENHHAINFLIDVEFQLLYIKFCIF